MKSKNLLLVAVSSICCLGGLTACSGGDSSEIPPESYLSVERSNIVTDNNVYPIIKDEYKNEVGSFVMMSHSNTTLMADWSKNAFFKRMKALTGVDISFDKVFDDSTYGEKFALTFLDEDTMPDFFYKALCTRQNELKFGEEGLLLPLEGLIEEYCPNLKARMAENPMVEKIMKSANGHIYALPTIHTNSADKNIADGYYFINKKWCDRLSIDVNSITTIEKLRDVLRRFKTEDANGNGNANDEYPMYVAGSVPIYYLFGGFGYNLIGWNSYVDDDGKVKVGAQEEKYKEMLKFFNSMYNEQLFNQDYITRTTAQQRVELMKNKIGVFMEYSTEVAGDYANDYVALPPLYSSTYYNYPEKAFYPGRIGVDPGAFLITKKCKHPEVLMRWIDTLYDVEYSKWDTIGKEKTATDQDGEWMYDDDTKTTWHFTEDLSTINSERAIQYGGGLPGVEMTYDDFMTKCSDEIISHSYTEIAKVLPTIKTAIPNLSMDTKTTRSLSAASSAISVYVGNLISNAIAGSVNLDTEWDNIQANLRKMGVTGYIQTLQQEVDKFYGR